MPPAPALPDNLPPIPAVAGISPRKVMLSGQVPLHPEYWAGRAGDSPFAPGEKLVPGTWLPRRIPAWYHPDVPPERPIPFAARIIFANRDLVVADKPHFLPTTSNGRLVRETLQTRLRLELGEDHIVPLHRLDRLTAGVVICSRNPSTRGIYQQLFSRRQVKKTYQAKLTAALEIGPTTVELGMKKLPGVRAVQVCPGGKKTLTRVRAAGHTAWLEPLTGHTHQLRVLLNHLGAPIVGDDTYPEDLGLDLYDFSNPLALLAREIEFMDPLSTRRLRFSSTYQLGAKM